MLFYAFALAAAGSEIEYLYIDASEGTASGGHAALKLGDEVFHFQHVPPGLVRVKRDDFKLFLNQYGDRENRSIRLHRVEVSAETRELLRERFNRVLLIEDEQFDKLDALKKDRLMLKAFLRLARRQNADLGSPERLELKGAGLFQPDGWKYSGGAEKTRDRAAEGRLVQLAERIEAMEGSGFLVRKSQEILHRLKTMTPPDYDPHSIVLSEDRFVLAGYSFAERYSDHLCALLALQVLSTGAPLREGVLLRPQGDEFRLSDRERQGLADYRRRVEDHTIALFLSQRPDWGLPLLLGMARLIVLDESIASGRLVFLDLAEPTAGKDEPVAVADESGYRQFEKGRSRFIEAKSAFAGTNEPDEWIFVRLEQAANLFFELGNALREGRPERSSWINQAPTRIASVEAILPDMTTERLEAFIGKLEVYLRAYEAKLMGLYRYDLIRRNCVTEIFRMIDEAMLTAAPPSKNLLPKSEDEHGLLVLSESTRRLGGHVAGRFFDFIPFVSFSAVEDHWRISSTREMPSYRLRRLDRARSEENPLLVNLRESNVLSSNLYHWHGGDSAFLFFTDDAIWARPLAGSFNLAAGLAQGLYGLLSLPWDQGKNLWQGTKGVLVSLPELFFFNIRKGSFPGLHDVGE